LEMFLFLLKIKKIIFVVGDRV